ncbi:MAG: glycosyltransferase family 2 protein [Rhodanobacter sp.]
MNIPETSPLPVAPILSVLVVAADSGATLQDCLRRVLACELPLELILADNASADGVPQAIAREHAGDSRFQLISHQTNLGFGPAMNRAAAQAHGEVLMLLNPDCLLEPSNVQRLLAELTVAPRTGLLGAVVCDEQGVADPASYRRDPLLRRAVASLLGHGSDRVNIDGAIPDHLVEAEAVSGALMLLPRPVFEQLGGFDEAYFLHCEDLDLCRRVRDAGYRVMLAGDVRVLHGKGSSSAHRPIFVSRHKHRGMWRWFRKFDPAARNPLLAAVVWLGIWVHFALQIPGQCWRLQVTKKQRENQQHEDV